MLKKKKRRIISFLLVCILTLSLPFAVSAATSTQITIFTFTTVEVHDLLTTDDSGKRFLPSSYKGKNLYVDGLFYHTDQYATRNTIRTGACYWNGSYYARDYGLSKEGKSNVRIYGSTSMSALKQTTYYYGFVTNLDSAGYVAEGTGRLSYASS